MAYAVGILFRSRDWLRRAPQHALDACRDGVGRLRSDLWGVGEADPRAKNTRRYALCSKASRASSETPPVRVAIIPAERNDVRSTRPVRI